MRTLAVIVVGSLLGLTGCGGADGGSSQSGRLTVAVATLDAENWAPWLAAGSADTVMAAVGEPLVRINPETRALEPGLAESWELSDDKLTWTFKLRPDVPFQGGYGTMTSDDVKFTWGLLIRKDSVHSVAAALRRAVDDDIEKNFEVVGPLEFRIHTPRPMVTLPADLSDSVVRTLRVTSEAYWDEVGEEKAALHPIGTGPLEFVSHRRGVDVTLRAVKDHYRHAPDYDEVVIKIVPEEGARLSQLQSGDLDLAPISPTLTAEAEAASLRIFNVPGTALPTVYFGGMYPGDDEAYDRGAPWIQADAPDRGRAIREAMSLAIDRGAIAEALLRGYAKPARGGISAFSSANYFDDAWPDLDHDVERAKELMREGGYADGFRVEMPIFNLAHASFQADIAESIAAAWEELGIAVERRPMDFSPTFRELNVGRKTQGMVFLHSFPPFDEFVTALETAFLPDSVFAYFYDPAIEQGVTALRNEPEVDRRGEIGRDISATLLDDYRVLPVIEAEGTFGASDRVTGWQFAVGTGQIHRLEYVEIR